jgi:hypothetical protein
MAELPRARDVEAQRAAMRKLSFLIGSWSGEARGLRGRGELIEMVQSEEAQYKLDGLILTIEGVGRAKSDGRTLLQALGLISYDDASGTYFMRAFNDGRWLETEVKLSPSGRGMTWGFVLGEIQTKSSLEINEQGEWTEFHELTIGSQPPRTLMELNVKKETGVRSQESGDIKDLPTARLF